MRSKRGIAPAGPARRLRGDASPIPYRSGHDPGMTSERRPSARLRMMAALMRRIVKPHLKRTATPQIARAEFDRAVPRLIRRPPFLLRRVRPATGAAPEMHW